MERMDDQGVVTTSCFRNSCKGCRGCWGGLRSGCSVLRGLRSCGVLCCRTGQGTWGSSWQLIIRKDPIVALILTKVFFRKVFFWSLFCGSCCRKRSIANISNTSGARVFAVFKASLRTVFILANRQSNHLKISRAAKRE